MSLDSRGIRRGHCTACQCDGYDGGSDMKKCLNCAHSPGKHVNLDHGGSQSPATSHHHPQTAAVSSHHAMGVHHHVPIQLPLCAADGCTNPVWYNPYQIQVPFAYCGPECRDKHLLPIRHIKLKEELEELKMELQQEVMKEITFAKQREQQQQQQQSHGHTPPSSKSIKKTEGSSSTAPAKGNKQETKTKTVELKIDKSKPSGIILSKKPLIGKDSTISGFVIVGAVRDSKVYKMLQDDSFRMLDVIVAVDGKKCSDIFSPQKASLQECFEFSVKDKTKVKLSLDRSIALPPVSRPLSFGRNNCPEFNRITVLMYHENWSRDKYYGLDLSGECLVSSVTTDSPAYLSGVSFGDEICTYTVATHGDREVQRSELVRESRVETVKEHLAEAQKSGKHVIMLLKR